MSLAPSRAAPARHEAPPSPPSPPPADGAARLLALRAELDEVDDALHDLLMRRAALVAEVGALGAKGRVPLRPGREAAILRRLLRRNAGPLAPDTLVRVWRAVLAGSSAQQNAMRVVVADPALLPAAREHFGTAVSAAPVADAACLAQLGDGRATLAVLPLPSDAARWWTELGRNGRWPGLHVVARLPFLRRAGAAEFVEAVVLSPAAPDPSGADRSLLAGPADELAGLLARAGLPLHDTLASGLVEVDGFVAADDPRLPADAAVLGAYAIPIGVDR